MKKKIDYDVKVILFAFIIQEINTKLKRPGDGNSISLRH